MTTENNKNIAEFMNSKNEGNNSFIYNTTEKAKHKFHSDWNDLMQVVEKIESLKTPITNNSNLIGQFEEYDFIIENKFIAIYAHGEVTKDIYQGKRETKIEAVYNACVEFIKWYNEQNK